MMKREITTVVVDACTTDGRAVQLSRTPAGRLLVDGARVEAVVFLPAHVLIVGANTISTITNAVYDAWLHRDL